MFLFDKPDIWSILCKKLFMRTNCKNHAHYLSVAKNFCIYFYCTSMIHYNFVLYARSKWYYCGNIIKIEWKCRTIRLKQFIILLLVYVICNFLRKSSRNKNEFRNITFNKIRRGNVMIICNLIFDFFNHFLRAYVWMN